LSQAALDAAVAVPVASDADVARAARQFQAPTGLRVGLFYLDVSLDGSVSAPATGTRIRGASFTIGDALAALASATDGAPIILRRVDAAYDPAQITAVVEAFEANPEAAFVTSNVGLAGAGGVQHVINPAQDADRPPQCWDAGLAIRGSSAGTVTGAAWFPSVLSAYLTAQAAGRTHNLDTAYTVVSQDTFAAERFPHYANLHLLHAHQEPFGLDTPWLSIIVPCSGTITSVSDTLESLYGQVLPPGTFEVVTVDYGDGSLATTLGALSYRQPSTAIAAENATLGAALQAGVDAARGQVVLFVGASCVAFPDLAEHHIRAHRDRPGQLIVVMGSMEHPLENLHSPVARALASADPAAWVLDREGVPLQPAHRILAGNLSMLRDAVVSAGGFDSARGAAAAEDLGWRLEAQGYETLAIPDARVRVVENTDLDAWFAGIVAREADRVALHAASTRALDASGLHHITKADLSQLLEQNGASVAPVRAALDGLAAGPQLYSLENLGGDWVQLASDLEGRAGQLLTHLQRIAEATGRLQGLEAVGHDSYAALLRSQKLPLPGARGTRYLLRPIADDELGWLGVLARYLVGFGPMDDTTLVVYADPENGGPAAEEVRTAVLELTKRIEPGPKGGWADVQVAEASGTPGELDRLVGTVDGWTPTGRDEDATIEAIANDCGTPALSTETWLLRGTDGVEPWPIMSRARFRLFVWPDWSSDDELRTVFDALARPLANREDAALILRYDVRIDGDPEVNLKRMAEAYEAVLGEGYGLDVVLLDDISDDDSWVPRLGAALHAVGTLPSSASGERKALIDQLGLPAVTDMMGVTTQLFSMAPLPLGPLYVPTLSLH